MHAQPYSEAPANPGRGCGGGSGGKRTVEVQIVRDLLHSRSGSGSGCITNQNYFWIPNRVYQSWLLRFSTKQTPRYSMTRHFPYRSDKLSSLRATVRIDRVSLSSRNQEFSGWWMLGANLAGRLTSFRFQATPYGVVDVVPLKNRGLGIDATWWLC